MARLRVLVVDDAQFIRDYIKKGLRAGYPDFVIDDASNGRAAQEQLQRNAYDIVLCDWEMPELSGAELLGWVRAQEGLKDIPFIMVTSRGEKQHVLQAIQAGVSGYLVKPFTIEGLVKKMAEALGKRRKGAAAPQEGAAPAALKTVQQEQIEILTGKGARAPEPSRTPPARGPKGVAQIRFANTAVKIAIKDISLSTVLAVTRRDGATPGILEPVVVDLEHDEAIAATGINGFVYMIQAAEASLETQYLTLGIKFVDQDPAKQDKLARYVMAIRR